MNVFEPARREIADALRARPHGYWTVDEIAARQRIDRTVAFDHLEALVAAGLATKVRLRGRRGRPANAYRYSGATVEVSYPPRRHGLLADVLAMSIRTGAEPRAVARERGLAATLDREYEFEDGTAHARTCMFGSVCGGAGDVVCAVHAGWIEGALEAGGRSCAVSPLGPDGLGGCRFRLSDVRG